MKHASKDHAATLAWAKCTNRTNSRSRIGLPGAFIFLSGQLIPPGEQQTECSELLGVERFLLLPLQLQIRLLGEYRFHVFLHGRGWRAQRDQNKTGTVAQLGMSTAAQKLEG